MIIFAKQSTLDVWQSSEYASGLLKLFCLGSKRNTQEYWLYVKLMIVFTPNFEFFPYSEVIQYMEVQHSSEQKYNKNFKKMINYSIWCFWPLFHFFHSNVPDSKCHRQRWRVLFFARIKLARAIARIKWRRLTRAWNYLKVNLHV